jgi:hypothetical protein
MNRVLFGNTGAYTGPEIHGPDAVGDNPDYFNRQNETGMFISKPGQDVLTCNSAELLFSTDSSSNGFLMVMGRGNVTLTPTDDILIPKETKVETGIVIPHHGDPTALMVNWFPIAGMGKTYGSNLYDCMGGNGPTSWDGNGSRWDGLPNGYNELYTGNDEQSTYAVDDIPIGIGMRRRHFWQHPDVGVNNYHLSNTVITNDPSAFFWSWFEQPSLNITLPNDLPTRLSAFEDLNLSAAGINWTQKAEGFTGTDSLSDDLSSRSMGGGLKTQGDFLFCETHAEEITGSDAHSSLVLKFFNGHSKIKYRISYIVYRERGAF